MASKSGRNAGGRRGGKSPGVEIELGRKTHETLERAAARAGKPIEEVAAEAVAEGIRNLQDAEPAKPTPAKDAGTPKSPPGTTPHAIA